MRTWLAALLLAPAIAAANAPPYSAAGCAQDFDTLWKAIDEGYAYFGSTRTQWRAARSAWRPRAAGAKSREHCMQALTGMIEQLRDDHVSIGGEGLATRRRVPAETDVWARFEASDAVVTAVRPGSVADAAGMQPGHVVTSIRGVAVAKAVRELLGPAAGDAAARDWALRHLLAGPRSGTYLIGVRQSGSSRLIEVARADGGNGNGPPLIARKIGEERTFGYLRIKSNLGDPGLLTHFDAALAYLKDTRALILDLRETQAGGSEVLVRAILGRFIAEVSPWQAREARGKSRVTDTAAPRGPFRYRAPIVVLVDRWTAAEGEALAAGLESTVRATLVGTEMAGLNGRLHEELLRHTGLVARFPRERTFLPNGMPREALKPEVWVDLARPSGGPGDPILYQALKLLESRK